MGFEILEVLDSWEEPTSQDSYLIYWIINNDTISLEDYLNSGFLVSISYNLLVSHNGISEVLISNGASSSEVSIAFRALTIDGHLWKVTLELWYE